MANIEHLICACQQRPMDAAILLAGAVICILALEAVIFAVAIYEERNDEIIECEEDT